MRNSSFNLNTDEVNDLISRINSSSLNKAITREARSALGGEALLCKEASRSLLGNFHRALGLNEKLEKAGPQEKENVLKLIHDMALRVVIFIDEALKLEPEITKKQDIGKDFEFSRTKSEGHSIYELEYKSGYRILVNASDHGEGVPPMYEIKISDQDAASVVAENEVQTLKSRDEELSFDMILSDSESSPSLSSLSARAFEQDKKADGGDDVFVDNVLEEIDANSSAIEDHELGDLRLNPETSYVKSLSQALFQRDEL